MKCSLKDGFIILLIIFIVPSSLEGREIPLLQQTSPVLDKPMNFKQFKTARNRLQDLDSFPDVAHSETKLHKIVKKQMAKMDGKDLKKNKRSVLSVFNLPECFYTQSTGSGDFVKSKDDGNTKRASNDFESLKPSQHYKTIQKFDSEISEELLEPLKGLLNNEKKSSVEEVQFPRSPDGAIVKEDPNADSINPNEKKVCAKPYSLEKAVKEEKVCSKLKSADIAMKVKPYSAKPAIKGKQKCVQTLMNEKKETAKTAATYKEAVSQMNAFLRKKFMRIPDEHDFRYYYECEAKPFGCMKLRHKRCPKGQFFSYKYLKCLKAPRSRKIKLFKRLATSSSPKKIDVFDNSEDPEPANEWLDANQGPIQKIPPEFKPKKAPGLKIYHLCLRRKINELLRKQTAKRNALGDSDSTFTDTQINSAEATRGTVKRHGKHQHHPRSFLIRIKKKEDKESQDQSINESDENEDEDDEENDEEEDEDEDSEDEDEETEEETSESTEKEKLSHKEHLKELFKSAKAAVTNRARFNDPTRPESDIQQKEITPLKSKKPQDTEDKSKKVLIDANIKVDRTIGNALKYILKSKTKGNKESRISLVADDEALICDRGSQDQMDPELLRMYEHLIRNNPRVKRYFLAHCIKKGN